jgi:hypothetical protein
LKRTVRTANDPHVSNDPHDPNVLPFMALRRSSALLLAAVLLSGCDVRVGEHGVSLDIVEGKATEEWTRSYSLRPGGELEIVNGNGPIEVFPATGTQVEVRATREARARTDEAARQALDQHTINESVTPERVALETVAAKENGFRRRVNVTYRINVPAGLNVSLRSQNGGARLENVDGRFRVASTNGQITGRGISGSIDASTVNGGITMELISVTHDVRIVTVNGAIRLDLRPDVNATLEASAINGGVVVRDGVALEATERDRQRVAGRINKGGPKIVAQTTNGGVVIRAATGARREPDVVSQELRER